MGKDKLPKSALRAAQQPGVRTASGNPLYKSAWWEQAFLQHGTPFTLRAIRLRHKRLYKGTAAMKFRSSSSPHAAV
jgi:hypothetical protein